MAVTEKVPACVPAVKRPEEVTVSPEPVAAHVISLEDRVLALEEAARGQAPEEPPDQGRSEQNETGQR